MAKNKWLMLSVLSVVSGIGVASAQPGGGPAKLEKLDTNGDGTVTTSEFQAHLLTRFDTADTNKDGKITADEAKAAFDAHKQGRFEKLDTNGNGTIERSEVEKMPEGLFTKIDADKSGTLSQAEFEAGHPKAPEGKVEGKGMHHGLPGDTNNDGTVTKEEATAEAQKLTKKLDADSDGKLTQEELSKMHHGGPEGRGGPRMGGVKRTVHGDAGVQ